MENAVTQRNEAREASLRLEAELKQKDEEIATGRLIPATPDSVAPTQPVPMRRRMNVNVDSHSSRFRQTKSTIDGSTWVASPSAASVEAQPPALTSTTGIFAGPGQEYPEDDRTQQEIYLKQQQMYKEQKRQDEEKLLQSLSTHLGFQKGRPLAAVIIFRCCLQWKSFQADKTSIFDRIIHTIGKQIEDKQDDNNILAYWLTNIVTLLYMLQKNIKPASSGAYAKQRTPNSGRSFLGANRFTSFLTRVATASPSSLSEASVHGGGAGGFSQVEAKYPALLFKQQLDAFVQKIFPMLRDNIRKDINNHLSACILAPKGIMRSASIRSSRSAHGGDSFSMSLT